jgi:cell wall-associated NlpC family hydrolase
MKRITTALGTATLAGLLAFAAAAPAHATTAAQTTILKTARAQIGDRYVYGGNGPTTFDCSGLTRYAAKSAGKAIPRTAQAQYNAIKHISPADRQAGDLIFIGHGSRGIYHAGVFAGVRGGKGYMVNANTGAYRGRKVVEAPVTEYTSGSPVASYGRP